LITDEGTELGHNYANGPSVPLHCPQVGCSSAHKK